MLANPVDAYRGAQHRYQTEQTRKCQAANGVERASHQWIDVWMPGEVCCEGVCYLRPAEILAEELSACIEIQRLIFERRIMQHRQRDYRLQRQNHGKWQRTPGERSEAEGSSHWWIANVCYVACDCALVHVIYLLASVQPFHPASPSSVELTFCEVGQQVSWLDCINERHDAILRMESGSEAYD